MNQQTTQHRTSKPWRQYVSLFLSVVWLSVLVQPCAMADSCNIADSGFSAMGQMTPAVHDNESCTQCPSLPADCEDCGPASNHVCYKADNTVGFDTTAAFEQKTKVKKFELSAFSIVQLTQSRLQKSTFLAAKPPESLPSGPSIIDLYQTYLI